VTFPELLDTALAGTLNQAPSTAEVSAEQELSTERRVVRRASLEGLRWLAGRPPGQPEPGVAPECAAPETLAEVSPAAAARLADILDRRPEALLEWLQLACERRLRVPPMLLPDVLEIGRYQGVLERELIVEAGGARIVWLAQLNPAWAFAAHADAEDQFARGSREDRAVALRRIRRRDPAHARDLLRAAWQSERGEARAGLLAALEPGLSLADEGLLVDAVHDTRREIREVALRLLRHLPGSSWAARWTARAASVIRLAGNDLLVGEPEEIDAAWRADGIDARPPKGMSATEWLLQQVMALTPPDSWPHEMLERVLRGAWREPLVSGLAQAAATYASARWCRTLVIASLPGVDPRPLYAALPAPQALDVLTELIESRGQKHHATLAAVLREAAWHLDPAAAPRVEAWLDGDSVPLWFNPALVRVVDTLDYRLAMRRELDM
jgi:hypothetical protein